MRWKTRRKTLDLSQLGVVMGILNTTPDSFSDGGEYVDVQSALKHALKMVSEGASIIDIGGESTRPGAKVVDVTEEIKRTVPVIKALREVSDVLISIDTSKAIVAEAALVAGADIVNDVTGLLGDADMAETCLQSGAGVCVMHMQGRPQTMQRNPSYEEGVTSEIQDFFSERLASLVAMGMEREAICFDPGIGFGKTQEHNMALLNNLGKLQGDRPLLLGVSRKSVLRRMLNDDTLTDLDSATAVVTALAYDQGVKIHRVHDVALNKQSLKVVESLAGY